MASASANKDSNTQDAEEEKGSSDGRLTPTLSKRKKNWENTKDWPKLVPKSPVVSVTWKQTSEDLSIFLKLIYKLESPDDVEATFTDADVTLTFSDGSSWTCSLFAEIHKEQSRVLIKGQTLALEIIKKKKDQWPSFEQIPSSDSTVLKAEASGAEPNMCESTGSEVIDKETEKMEKDEEPIYHLDHIKHDFFERDDNFHLHIYVKSVHKDAVTVQFEEDFFLVKFQSRDGKFLQLHCDTSEDTVFCWNVKVRRKIKPALSKYKVTSSYIELRLRKTSSDRWGGLEAPLRKEAEISKSETWISASKTSTSRSGVVFDELNNVSVASRNANSLDGWNTSNDQSQSCLPSTSNKENTIKKPTCKVQPLNKNEAQQIVPHGFTGLDNLGNTCFMNSVLQAVANTREFRDYFFDGTFQKEINPDNPLGTGGNLAVTFAVLLKNLWSGRKQSIAPGKLKDLIAKKASQFTGFAQHDAQEFMAFLLDGLHEDINRVRKKPYTQTIDSDGRPDEVVAREAWEVYKKRNDSFVVDLFQGQYKSKLVCPVCGKLSITFDPFLYLSIPLPKKCRLFPVTFMWKDPYRKPVRFMLRLPKEASVEQLKEDLYKKTGVKPKDMRVFEAFRGKIHKIFAQRSSLSGMQANDSIIVSEVLSEEVAGEEVYEVFVIQRTLVPHQFPSRCSNCRKLCPADAKLKRCTKCYKVGYCDQSCQRSHWHVHKSSCNSVPEPVGCPFVISIPESRATYSRMCKLMEAYARYSVDVFQPPVQSNSTNLTSHPSNSNLSSSSSQSSGSLNSLDSQSSSTSTCTLTAEGEQLQNDTADVAGDISSTSVTAVAGSMTSLDSGSSATNISPNMPTTDNFDSLVFEATQEVSKDQNFTLGTSAGMEELQDNTSGADSVKLSGKNVPTNPVLGIQNEDSDRVKPLFHIKPVSQEGFGLKGPDRERLDDKGDVPLDLSCRKFLSIDWKNNEKIPSYVLVQSKELEADDHESMQTISSEDYNNITLEQCLELFTEPEVLSPDEAWYCTNCKKHQEATKQMSIWQLPHTLIIQLKRFSFRNIIFRDKIDKMVEFPTRGLDLSNISLGQKTASGAPPVYDLYAVINHHGGILGGHYTAYVRCTDTKDSLKNEVDWRLCDDSHVSSISNEKNVVTRAAYLLFYRQRNAQITVPKELSEHSGETEYQDTVTSLKPGTSTYIEKDEEEKHDDEKDKCDSEKENSDDSSQGTSLLIDEQCSYNTLDYTDMDAVD